MRFKYLVILFFSLNLFAQELTVRYTKSRIYFNSNAAIKELIDQGISADHGTIKHNTYIESVFSTKELDKARSLGYKVEVLIADMQKFYKEHVRDAKTSYQRNPNPCDSEAIEYTTPTNFNLGSMGGFLTYTQMLAELDEMQSLYPDLITVKTQIGTFNTIENRPIYWVKISDNPTTDETEPEILYTAIHHAREPASMQQLIFYMWYLLENYANDSQIKSLVDNTEMYFVPVINVDGYLHNESTDSGGGGMWRKNRRDNGDGYFGVDLNRNYSYEWGGLGTGSSGSQTFPGTAAFSEPETQAIKWFCEEHEFVMAINNHTYSGLLLYPFGYDYNQPTPDDATFKAISSLMVSENGYINQISSDLYPASGVSDDWMYGDTTTHNKIFAMTPEIGHDFWPAQSDIIPICKDMMFHNLTAARLIHNYASIENNSPYFIIDKTGSFEYTIKGLGLGNPGNFTVSITPVSGNIISIGSSNNHSGLAITETQTGSISYQLDNTIQYGDEISYKLVINNGLFDLEKEITKIYGVTTEVFIDDCSSSTTHWDNSNWGLSTSSFVSAPSSITDSPSGDYANNSNKSIVLKNPIDLTDAIIASVSFYAKWDIENNYDYVQFEVSTDNGSNWQPQCGNYTNIGVSNQNAAEGKPLYDGIQSDWVLEKIDLSAYIGSQVLFKFKLVSDVGVTKDGFYFDDLSVKIIDATSVGTTNLHKEKFVLYPNPAKNQLIIKSRMINKELVCEVLSTTGQLISTHLIANSIKSINVNHLKKGFYFLRIHAQGSTIIKKFIKE
jgi:hypothetical protein